MTDTILTWFGDVKEQPQKTLHDADGIARRVGGPCRELVRCQDRQAGRKGAMVWLGKELPEWSEKGIIRAGRKVNRDLEASIRKKFWIFYPYRLVE